jgi:hypothetical protein
MIKRLIEWIVKRFKYANKVDLIKGLLDGIDDEDINNIYKVLDGRLNPVLVSDKNCSYKTISLSDTINNTILIIIQDNKIIAFSEFHITFSNGWRTYAIINGQEQEIVEDDHTKIYLLM